MTKEAYSPLTYKIMHTTMMSSFQVFTVCFAFVLTGSIETTHNFELSNIYTEPDTTNRSETESDPYTAIKQSS